MKKQKASTHFFVFCLFDYITEWEEGLRGLGVIHDE